MNASIGATSKNVPLLVGDNIHVKLLGGTEGREYCKSLLEHEAFIMADLNHPKVVYFFGLYYVDDCINSPPYLVMEQCHFCLRSFINRRDLRNHTRLSILSDVAAGLD